MNINPALRPGPVPAPRLHDGRSAAMGALYFFHKGGRVRVPLNGSGGVVLNLLKNSGLGFWDQENHQLVMAEDLVTKTAIGHLFYAFAQVHIDEDLPEPAITQVIWKSPWQNAVVPSPVGNSKVKNKPEAEPAKIAEPAQFFGDMWQSKLETELAARKYSRETKKAYIYFNKELCAFSQKPPPEIGMDTIKLFLADLNENRHLSASSMNLAISAVKFFYERILGRGIVNEQRRPTEDKQLPAVLAKTEIRKMLDAIKNPKHRLLIMLVYSAGLRVGEVVRLRREDIDFERKTLFVRDAKGRKDRYTMLSEVAGAALGEYLQSYEIEGWLFPGQPEGRHLSIRSAQKIFDKTLEKAGVRKDISIHGLRHSFATHLLEGGTDVHYIQKLLGHTSIRTTERYTHVAAGKVLSITSPLDTINGPKIFQNGFIGLEPRL